MSQPKIAIVIISLIVVALVVAGCGSAKTLELAEMNAWRVNYNDLHADARITFSPGDKCSLDILNPSRHGFPGRSQSYAYEIVVNDQTYQNYMVTALTMDEGKTLADLEKYDKAAIGKVLPPYFSDLQTLEIVPPMSRTLHGMLMPNTPIYFVCLIQGPDEQRVISQFGPVEIP